MDKSNHRLLLECVEIRCRRLITLCILGVLLAAWGCQNDGATTATTDNAETAETPVQRGEHLVAVLGCNDCHTPMQAGPDGPAPDMARMLSGHPESMQMPPPPALPEGPWLWLGAATNTAFAGPWGITYAPNLTPDSTTGLAQWTEEMFVNSLKTGKQMGLDTGRPIMPPMPWPGYSKLSDEDLRAIYAYLQAIPAIKNEVPPYQPPAEGPQ